VMMANVLGPDVSVYQDLTQTPQGIDFAKMRQGAGFVIIKVGQNQQADPDFHVNWGAAKQAGLPRGSYWLFERRSDAKAQATLFVQTLGGDQGELPLFVDFEETYGGPFSGWQNWKIFLDQAKGLLNNKELGIYTAQFYWQQNGPDPKTQSAALQYFH